MHFTGPHGATGAHSLCVFHFRWVLSLPPPHRTAPTTERRRPREPLSPSATLQAPQSPLCVQCPPDVWHPTTTIPARHSSAAAARPSLPSHTQHTARALSPDPISTCSLRSTVRPCVPFDAAIADSHHHPHHHHPPLSLPPHRERRSLMRAPRTLHPLDAVFTHVVAPTPVHGPPRPVGHRCNGSLPTPAAIQPQHPADPARSATIDVAAAVRPSTTE